MMENQVEKQMRSRPKRTDNFIYYWLWWLTSVVDLFSTSRSSFLSFFFCSSFGRSVACERLKEINRRWHRWWVRSLVSITVSYGFATEQKATVSSGFYFYLRVRIENSIKSESHGIRLDILCVRLQYTQHSFVRVFFSHLSPSLSSPSFFRCAFHDVAAATHGEYYLYLHHQNVKSTKACVIIIFRCCLVRPS